MPTPPEPSARPAAGDQAGGAAHPPHLGAAAHQLRREIQDRSGIRVVTGGQTGVDTAAALAAIRAGLAVHLIFPSGLLQEDGPLPETRHDQMRGADLHELTSPEFRDRTWTAVYCCDAIILLDPAGGEGCQETERAADQLAVPLLRVDAESVRPGFIAGWLEEVVARIVLVAGCRGSLLARAGLTDAARSQAAAIIDGVRIWRDRAPRAD